MAGVGAAQAAGGHCVEHVGAADHGGDRHAAAQALGQRRQVGRDAVVLHGKQPPGAGNAGLDFVGDEQDSVLVAQPAQAREEGGGCRQVAAFALHRLDHDGRHP